ncbi:MAG: hypothetical protein QX189_01615 [Methylococcales bacterium]|jgi:hypothetical protein
MSYKIPFIQIEGVVFSLEPYPDYVFVHCDVQDNPSLSTIKEMLRKWKQFRDVTCLDFYALHSDSNNKPTHKKFLTMFNFKFLETRKAKDGETVEIWFNSKGK